MPIRPGPQSYRDSALIRLLHTKQRFLKNRFEIDYNCLYISILTLNIDNVNEAKSGLTSFLVKLLIIN